LIGCPLHCKSRALRQVLISRHSREQTCDEQALAHRLLYPLHPGRQGGHSQQIDNLGVTMSLLQELMNQAARGELIQPAIFSRFTPKDIREAIQQLVATEQLELAYALGDAGISLYPGTEDMLAINGLLAIIRQEWAQAVELLTELTRVQGDQTQPFTYVMLVRALRCNLEPARALEVVKQGLQAYPNQVELVAESLVLNDYVDAMQAPEQAH
jgi:hypothetical protein